MPYPLFCVSSSHVFGRPDPSSWGGERGRPASPGEEVGRVGVVHFPTHRGEPAEAILGGDGRWHCPRLPVLDRVLNILFEPSRGGEAGAPFGHESLRSVAAWLKGATVEYFDQGDGPQQVEGRTRADRR